MGYLRNDVHARAFKPLPLSSATHENLPVAISKAPGMQDNFFLSKNVFWENAVRYLRYGVSYSFQTFIIVFRTHENLLVEISGALGMKGSHFLSKNVFWENAERHLRNGSC